MLLTDGTVLAQAYPGAASAGVFYRLTPDANGDYRNGTWTRLAAPPAGYAPYASAEAVLADGRVLFVGGEYNQDNYGIPFAPTGLTNMSAVFDPVAQRWTMIAPPPGVDYIGDVAATVMPDGSFVYGSKLDMGLWSLDPASLRWSALPSAGKNDVFAEEGFTLLQNNSLLTVDLTTTPASEHYVPSLGRWIQDGATPVALTSGSDIPGGTSYGPAPQQIVGGVTYGPGPTGIYVPPGEIGPALTRPDGTVFATGSSAAGVTAHTAIYHPGASSGVAGSWTAGPDFPNSDDAGDSSAALLPSGNVLVAGVSGALYEFDGSTLRRTAAGPSGASSLVFLLPLPSGQTLVLMPMQAPSAAIYTPVGAPNPTWAPTISAVPTQLTHGQSYTLSGTQLAGLSQGAAYGDELNAPTNYPIVRVTMNATRHVFYCRTHGHSTTSIAPGTAGTTQFDVPSTIETGAASLVVVANGIASSPVAVTLN
jgi:hypothetical protein